MVVIKADNRRERFNKNKIINSLLKIGLEEDKALEIAQQAKEELKGKITTDEIFNFVTSKLENYNLLYAGKYNLRRAIMNLGPTGYPFEKYIAKVLNTYNFTTKTNQVLNGKCVLHEVDVLAHKNNDFYFIECKYHNTSGAKSDVKVPLYIHSRFLDLKANLKEKNKYHYQMWLITNTKFTTEALKYGECMKIKMTGWLYPQNNSLETIIEKNKAYPINLFKGILNNLDYQKLVKLDIFLLKDLLKFSLKDLISKTQIKQEKISKLYQLALELCPIYENKNKK